jgi:hypothetical protein
MIRDIMVGMDDPIVENCLNMGNGGFTPTPIAATNYAVRSGMAERRDFFGVAGDIVHAREGDGAVKPWQKKGQIGDKLDKTRIEATFQSLCERRRGLRVIILNMNQRDWEREDCCMLARSWKEMGRLIGLGEVSDGLKGPAGSLARRCVDFGVRMPQHLRIVLDGNAD